MSGIFGFQSMVFLSICSRSKVSYPSRFPTNLHWKKNLGASTHSELTGASVIRILSQGGLKNHLRQSTLQISSNCFRKFIQFFSICTLKLTARPWKMVVEKRSFPFGLPSVFRGEKLVVGRILPTSFSIWSWDLFGCVTPATVRKKKNR